MKLKEIFIVANIVGAIFVTAWMFPHSYTGALVLWILALILVTLIDEESENGN